MKIQSKFRDYYDGVRRFGIDPKIHYARLQRQLGRAEIIAKNLPLDALTELPHFYHTVSFNQPIFRVVAFCGRLIPVWSTNDRGTITNYLSALQFLKACAKLRYHGAQKLVDEYEGKRWVFPTEIRRTTIEEWRRTHGLRDMTKYHKQLGAPVFLLEVHDRNQVHCEVNPILKPLGFSHIMDPETCWQELSIFIGNYLTDAREIPPVSDADLIVGKGFDKHSFRSEKKKK